MRGNLLTSVVLSGLTAAIAATAATSRPSKTVFPVVEVSKLILRDGQGNVRGRLEIVKGQPVLGLFDRDGKPRAEISISEEHAGFYLTDNGRMGVLMEVQKDSANLIISTPGQKEQVELRTIAGAAELLARDRAGVIRAAMKVDPQGPKVGLVDKAGRDRLLLGVSEQGEASAFIFNEARKVLLTFGGGGARGFLDVFDLDREKVWCLPSKISLQSDRP